MFKIYVSKTDINSHLKFNLTESLESQKFSAHNKIQEKITQF